jgi:PilZ domain
VIVVHNGNRLNATLRNISEGGAMIEGLWNMPAGSVLRLEFDEDKTVTAQVRWSRENRFGIEFHQPLRRRAGGTFAVLKDEPGSARGAGNW